VTVFVREGESQTESFHFDAPVGEVLKPGVYDRALRYEERGRPGMWVGRFEIKDFALGADGVPTRLWAVFEYQCEERTWPEFGEVRYNVPRPEAPAYAVPAVQRWSAWDFGRVRDRLRRVRGPVAGRGWELPARRAVRGGGARSPPRDARGRAGAVDPAGLQLRRAHPARHHRPAG
jgi:hypothetical protein